MTPWQIPRPEPDFGRLEQVFWHRGEPDRVPFIELYADPEPIGQFLGRSIPEFCLDPPEAFEAYHSGALEFFYRLGYDYVPCRVRAFQAPGWLEAEDTTEDSNQPRVWAQEGEGLITNWAEFERYPWPRIEDVDFSPVEYNVKHMPDGMKTIVHTWGVFELPMWLMGMETYFHALYDQPDLVEAIYERVGEIVLGVCRQAAELDGVGAVFLGDDLGFKSGTFINPDLLRKYVFPWYKRIADAVHCNGLPLLLHSCGNLKDVMDDLIETVGINAKHSYEDTFLSAPEAKRLYGDQIAILGGVDMDVLCRTSENELRAYARNVLDCCMPGGGYALGSGNTITNYVPLKNYLIMLEEGHNYGRNTR